MRWPLLKVVDTIVAPPSCPRVCWAITAAILAFVKPGDEILMPDSVYGPARTFSQGMLARLGVKTLFYDPASSAEQLSALFSERTRILYLESPAVTPSRFRMFLP